MYGESAGQRHGGLYVWDRADIPLDELRSRFEAAQTLPESQRTATMAPFILDNGARRVFVANVDQSGSHAVR